MSGGDRKNYVNAYGEDGATDLFRRRQKLSQDAKNIAKAKQVLADDRTGFAQAKAKHRAAKKG